MKKESEKLEIYLLFEAMYRQYGYDFRQYSYASARRRVLQQVKQLNLANVAALQHQIIVDEQAADQLLLALSINVTEMFRDPLFFKEIRQKVLPQLKDVGHLKIWHAGCSSGEEAYSMAIMLAELGLLGQSQLYATDFNADILKKAQAGCFSLKKMQEHISNYQHSGGEKEFAEYYIASLSGACIKDHYKKNIMFSHHNLTEDGCFGEMNMIVCRNVLIYFDKQLQKRVFQLFLDSLAPNGYLCLGSHETLYFSGLNDVFDVVSEDLKIYRRKQAGT